MSDQMMRQEIMEAINAGERALYSLRQAKEKLNHARTWGIVDLFGGGFFTDIMKHSKLDDAARYIEDAKYDLNVFQREIRDVSVYSDLRIELGGFLSFADFFCDGIVADYLVQSRIAKARMQIDHAISEVSEALSRLRRMYDSY